MFDKLKYRFQERWYNFMESSFLERFRSRYDVLSERDKNLLKKGLLAFAIFVFLWMMLSFVSGISKKEQSIEEAIDAITKVEELNDFVSVNKIELQKRKSETSTSKYVSLTDLIDKQQVAALINPEALVSPIKETPKKDVEKGKYVENSAVVKYKKITIRQLSKLLSGIEKNETFALVSYLKIKRTVDDIRYIDVEFEVIARTPK